MAIQRHPSAVVDRGAERERVRREMAGRPIAEVAEAMRAVFGDRPRRAYRLAHGWSLQQLADRYNALVDSEKAPMTKGRISEWELSPDSSRRLSIPGLLVLARLLCAPPVDLLDDEDRAHLSPTELIALGADGSTSSPATTRVARLTASVPNGYVPGAGPASSNPISEAQEDATALITWVEATSVGPHAIEELRGRVQQLARDHMHAPPAQTFSRAHQLARRARSLLQDGPQRPSELRDLYLVASLTYTLMAWIAGDVGQHGPATSQALAAWVCAERSGDPTVMAWARVAQAKVAYWAGDVAHSAAFAQDGLRHAAVDSAPALLACLNARAQADLGRRDEARSALKQAHHARDTVIQPDLGGVLSFSLANQSYMHGTALLRIGDVSAALSAAKEAVAAYEAATPAERFHGPLMMARLDAAHAYLTLAQADGALAMVKPVVQVPTNLRLDLFMQRLTSLRRVVSSHLPKSASARELADRIDAYSSPTPALP
jgi:tetratricopeptide (TPR) repeat protein/transcriptional regulator with XRE-family HTH domain